MTLAVDDVRAAAATIADAVAPTPVFGSARLGARLGVRLLLKAELLQKTGSFKPRGALNRLCRTDRAELARGLITVSAGNHGQALAWAAAIEGAACTVVMPVDAGGSKVTATRGYGAEVVLHGTVVDAYAKMAELRDERGLLLVHPFDDPLVIAGQGTVGLELVEQVPDVTTIVCPVGGGGLIAGLAVAAKSVRPGVRVVGVEPEGAAAMTASVQHGTPVRLETVETIVDGLAAPLAGEIPFGLVRRHVDEMVTVSDAEILDAVRELLTYAKLLAEPAGAAGLAALLSGAVALEPGETVVVVLSGGNLDLDRLGDFLSASPTKPALAPLGPARSARGRTGR